MPRPRLCRRVCCEPDVTYFKPAGIRLVDLEESVLTVDEFEAMRLKDLAGLGQETAAQRMNISQPTFHRLLSSARKGIADALVNGKAIRIEGGVYKTTGARRFKCSDCRHGWEVPSGIGRPEECPKCMSKKICRAEENRGFAGTAGGGCVRAR